ncbi:helix-turn-helix transcriptional regulator [Nocardia sp. CDC159]|uniref:Helix-turn-helix transcriptional regulator n=1 Tax=Nocardia pulmonis TaxID=2951408 RepID=A0A9X2E295_9NOCA|nr:MULTISPECIES: helix-turn-helix transcriptional regulator [Nocardia]MCM6772281.1 helix-turn-helix transcriptional regulator [Nocardia pulmonis]MCM6785061.1 helix-turn-helix transcriptional regulator [Nocardia sp. CDC159]
MTDRGELGRFLRSRRERVRPEEVGLPIAGVRRTPGLGCAELATLAGVSVDYYARLECGRETDPGAGVLYRLATALRLTDAEAAHLTALAARGSGRQRVPCRTLDRTICPATRTMLETLRPHPALVVSRLDDLLAANPAGLALFPGITDFPPLPRNLIRYRFLHPAARRLFADRERSVTGSVARLRAAAGDPDDPEPAALIGELCVKSPEFARLWQRRDGVQPGSAERYDHPTVGRMRLAVEDLPLPRSGGRRLIIHSAEPGTSDHDAMVLLDLSTQPTLSDPSDAIELG